MRLTIVRRNAGEVEGVGVISYEELISTNNFQRLITSAQAVEKHELVSSPARFPSVPGSSVRSVSKGN